MRLQKNKKIITIVLLTAVALVFSRNVLAQEFPGNTAQNISGVNPNAVGPNGQPLVNGPNGSDVTVTPTSNGINPATVTQPQAETSQQVGQQFTGIAGIIVRLGATLITWTAAMVDWAVRLGKDVVNLDAVQTGWKIVLGFTNLGFVLAIIVMAFATIFQYQSYAMKQTLWKLIVAALLVNFSLVIAGAFLSVSNIFTDFFLNQTTSSNLSNALMNAINIQGLADPQAPGALAAATNLLWADFGQILSDFFTYLASLVFIAIFTFLAILAFFTLFVMLLYRAIALVFLFILSPIVWLFWIFPATSQYWKKWWSEFLRWNFFAPAVLFFIYLAVRTAATIQSGQTVLGSITDAQANGAAGATTAASVVNGYTWIGVKGGFFSYSANFFVIIALLYGGIYLANKFGIAGGQLGVKAATGAGKWFGRNTVEMTGGKLLNAKFMRGTEENPGLVDRLSKSRIPGIRYVGRGLNRLGSTVEGYTKTPYEKLGKQLSDDRLNSEILNSRGLKRDVLLAEAAKRKEIHSNVRQQLFDDPKKMASIERSFKTSALNFKDVTRALGYTTSMKQAARDKDDVALKAETDKFAASQEPKDWAKGQWNGMVKSQDPEMKRILSQLGNSVARLYTGAYAKITPNIKGENLSKFEDAMREQIGVLAATATTKEQADQALKASNALTRALNNRALGEDLWTPGTSPGGATTTP